MTSTYIECEKIYTLCDNKLNDLYSKQADQNIILDKIKNWKEHHFRMVRYFWRPWKKYKIYHNDSEWWDPKWAANFQIEKLEVLIFRTNQILLLSEYSYFYHNDKKVINISKEDYYFITNNETTQTTNTNL